ncbi:hypothetical protein APHAL10511_005071 [Amanita phalloides]|nr:hypothetical protein APHAL10511_005071 [Amanita phalloides]
MRSNKHSSILSNFSLKFRKPKESNLRSGSISARSSVSDVSTLINMSVFDEKEFNESNTNVNVGEGDMLDLEDQAWGAPQSTIPWLSLFGRSKKELN